MKGAIITGACRGIGKAVAERLAADGYDLVISYLTSESAAKELVDRIRSKGSKAVAVKADISNEKDVNVLFESADKELNRLDLLVNNAGVLHISPLEQLPVDHFDRIFSVNVRGTFLCMQQAVKRMTRGGGIINLSSSSVHLNLPSMGAYLASKAAIDRLTIIMAKELAGRNIRVNAVAPGAIDTELLQESMPPDYVNASLSMIPLGRLGQPQEVASLVSFLAGDESSYINGAIFNINGGFC